jgi:hypothetical protein
MMVTTSLAPFLSKVHAREMARPPTAGGRPSWQDLQLSPPISTLSKHTWVVGLEVLHHGPCDLVAEGYWVGRSNEVKIWC